MFLLTADLHIGAGIQRQGSDQIKDSCQILDSIVETVKNRNIRYIIAAGDIFHRSRLKKEEINAFRNFVDQLTENGCCFMYIPGNHEKETLQEEGVGLPTAVNPEAVNITGAWDLEEYRIYGVPENSSDIVREHIRKSQKCDLLVAHTPVKDLFSLDNNAFTVQDVPETVQNVLVGHIHVPEKIEGLSSGGCIFSPGSMHATNLKEMEGLRGAWLTNDLRDSSSWEWIPIASQTLREYEVRTDDDPKCIVDTLKEVVGEYTHIPLTVNLKYVPGQRKNLTYIIHCFREDPGIRFVRTVIPDEDEVETEDESEEEEVESFTRNVEEAFAEEVPAEDKEAREFLHQYIHLGVQDSRETLRSWLKDQNVEKISI